MYNQPIQFVKVYLPCISKLYNFKIPTESSFFYFDKFLLVWIQFVLLLQSNSNSYFDPPAINK